jgi:hypothetical protein
MKLPAMRVRGIGIVSIVLIVGLSLGLFLHIQNISQASIKSNLFNQQRTSQMESIKNISQHITSDLKLIMEMLDGLANSVDLQQADFHSDDVKKLIEEKYTQYSGIINRLFVLDNNNTVAISLTPKGIENFLYQDLTLRDWVQETRASQLPVFSGGFERQGVYRIYITEPIINRHTHEYIGIVGTSIPTVDFFSHYGNVENINSKFLVVYDKNGIMLANGASISLLGQNFFGDYTQKFINHNQILNNLTRQLLAGKPGYGVYNYGRGERLTTQYPILINGRHEFSIQLINPTSQIYSQVQAALLAENEKMYLLLLGSSSAVVVLVIFLLKWNSTLNREVNEKTSRLIESERQARELETSYEEMKRYLHEVMREVRKEKTRPKPN